jgi:hypothetical protein
MLSSCFGQVPLVVGRAREEVRRWGAGANPYHYRTLCDVCNGPGASRFSFAVQLLGRLFVPRMFHSEMS